MENILLPATDEQLRELIQKLYKDATVGECDRGVAHTRLKFVHDEMNAAGKAQIYESEMRILRWEELGYMMESHRRVDLKLHKTTGGIIVELRASADSFRDSIHHHNHQQAALLDLAASRLSSFTSFAHNVLSVPTNPVIRDQAMALTDLDVGKR